MAHRYYSTEEALQMMFDPSFLESVLDINHLSVPNPLENADNTVKEYDSILNASGENLITDETIQDDPKPSNHFP